MTKSTSSLMSIGAFSQATRLSVRMLRHYAQRGVLEPEHVDVHTGYRYYSASQISSAVLVRTLRDIGLPIAAMTTVLCHRDDPDVLTTTLTAHRAHLDETYNTVSTQLRATDRLIARAKGPTMNLETTIQNRPAVPVAALRGVLATYPDEVQLWQKLIPLMDNAGVAKVGPCGVTYLDEDHKETDIDAEVWTEVASLDAEVPEPAVVKELPAARLVVTVVHGDYQNISDGFAAAAQYREEHSLKQSGAPFVRYVVGPEDAADPADYVSEVCLPIAP